MTKSQRGQPQRQQSVSQKRHDTQRRKKKHQSRQITHYFAPMGQRTSQASNSMPPQPTPINRKDRLLEQKKQEALMRSTSQKTQHQATLLAIRNVIVKQLRKGAQIDRVLSEQQEFVLADKLNTIQTLSDKLALKKSMMLGKQLPANQLYFLEKQLKIVESTFNKHQLELEELQQQKRLRIQEETCYLSKQNWPTVHKRYQPLRLIGKGGFSQVYIAYDLEIHSTVALKLSDVEHLLVGRGNKADYLRHIRREYEVHKGLNHPNIVQLIDVAEIDNAICIVLQYCQGPTLADLLRRHGTLSQLQAKVIIEQLLSVVFYLSCQKVVHYDLKPHNIIFDNGIAKVLDFGICKTFDSEHSKMALTSQGMGTYCYLPPQTFTNNPLLSPKVDIWSLGVIFYQMICGERPPLSQLGSSEQLTFPHNIGISPQAIQFIKGCLQAQVDRRLSPESAKRHSYFNDV